MAVFTVNTVESLILRATNPLNTEEDPNITQSICQAVGNETGGVQTSVRLLVHKMQSPQEKEAMQALLVLQACVNNCGTAFQNEIGKFRFLNEMVKLVSPKYLGNQTSDNVKKRVIELLYTWTLDLCDESKILEAYSMLKKQGIVKTDPQYLGALNTVTPKAPMPCFDDDEKSRMLQRLLQSTRPEDVSKANDMIKSMVKEDERRMERSSRRIVEVETAINNVKVLDEMLTQHEGNNSVSPADLELMGELNTSCSNLRTNIHRIVSEMDEKDDGLGELIKACDELFRVMGRYKIAIGSKSCVASKTSETSKVSQNTKPNSGEVNHVVEEDTLLDLLTDDPIVSEAPEELEPKNVPAVQTTLLGDIDDHIPDSKSRPPNESILDELGDIFDKEQSKLLMPVNLFSSKPMDPEKSIMDLQTPSIKDPILALKEEPILNNLDLLGSSLLQQSLPQDYPRLGSQFKPQEKISLNQMKQKTISNPPLGPHSHIKSDNQLRKSSNETNKEITFDGLSDHLNNVRLGGNKVKTKLIDNGKVLSSDGASKVESSGSIVSPVEEDSSCSSKDTKLNKVDKHLVVEDTPKAQLCEVKPMSDLQVTLQDIKPGSHSPINVLESNGVSMTFHFAENKPRPDVSIIVVTVTSNNPQKVTNYTLQAVVPKGCKVRLLPPSSTTLYEYSPFLPPPAITQIMMIANPNELNVSLKAMLSYTLNDDVITEMGELAKLPL